MLTFEQFRRKLEDVVTVAINRGVVVKFAANSYKNESCPLGCHPRLRGGNPMAFIAAPVWRMQEDDAEQFARGFDGKLPSSQDRRFYELGWLYRRRFGASP